MTTDTARLLGGSLGRRVQQIVQQPLDAASVRQTLQTLAASYGEAGGDEGALARLARHRDVRQDMAERAQALDEEFVLALGAVDAVFGELEANVAAIDQQCLALRQQVGRALRATAGAAQQAALLGEEQRDLQRRRTLAQRLAEKFTLAPAHRAALAQRPPTVDAVFFAALDRVAEARAECRLLGDRLAAREMAAELERVEGDAFDALLRWALAAVRQQLAGDAPAAEPAAELRRALARLAPHAALAAAAEAEIASVRCAALEQAFLRALATGGPGGRPRPIEAHAGDPQRFVGDMLAWVHQACASERELLGAMAGERGRDAGASALLPRALANVARPLEIRVAQTVGSMRDAVALYRVASVLGFYAALFGGALPGGALLATVQALERQAHAQLLRRLGELADAADFAAVTPALDAPPALAGLLAAATGILHLHLHLHLGSAADASAGGPGASVVDASAGGPGASVVDASAGGPGASVVDAIAGVLRRALHEAQAAAPRTRLRGYEQAMFELNVVGAVLDALAPFAQRLLAPCVADVRVRQAALVDELRAQLCAVLRDRAQLPLAQSTVGAAEIDAFNAQLKGASDFDVSRLVARLHNHALARNVAADVARLFVDEYAAFYARVAASMRGSAELALLLPPETVSTLL
ncbi:Golgi transport complex subunit 6 [Kickxella alabastrina]|uniref:Golgi transport complex subunit 6 n=1 Tax=Kickxella alabastrina TaxID=61397 RepID=A0ACC1I8Q8_9FUNG|nr:Golgi transport complex subunit 6 [Kickxella alabastrina]